MSLDAKAYMEKDIKTTFSGVIDDIKSIQVNRITDFVVSIRNYMVEQGFREVVLFDTTTFKVENTEYIKTSTGDLLRNTTEPEIWLKGMELEKFYCITSLFRKEDIQSFLHKNEFKILDFYIKGVDPDRLILHLFELLHQLEEELGLPKLSQLKVRSMDYEEFKHIDSPKFGKGIIKVINYPISESFYDEIDEHTNKSKKCELFFMGMKQPIEFSVFGKVDENRNTVNRIAGIETQQINFKKLKLSGMCLGIERIILCYQSLKSFA